MTKDDYLKRLRRIEGQVRGLQRMVDSDTYCIDVLTQISAASRALQGVAATPIEDHARHGRADPPPAATEARLKDASVANPRLGHS